MQNTTSNNQTSTKRAGRILVKTGLRAGPSEVKPAEYVPPPEAGLYIQPPVITKPPSDNP